METTLSLQSNLYLKVTPAGAYYAVSRDTPNAGRTLLYGLLCAGPTEAISNEKILAWTDTNDINTTLNLSHHLQRLGFLYDDENVGTDDIHLTDEQLPDMLVPLSNSSKALLAGEKGLYSADVGFHHETAEELGLLANKVAKMKSDHQLLIRDNLRTNSNAWGACDPSGQSKLTFFPLYIGTTKLILMIGGIPDLNREAFITLIKVLYHRYGSR